MAKLRKYSSLAPDLLHPQCRMKPYRNLLTHTFQNEILTAYVAIYYELALVAFDIHVQLIPIVPEVIKHFSRHQFYLGTMRIVWVVSLIYPSTRYKSSN